MSNYIERNLGKDECVILQGKTHWGAFIPHVFLMMIYVGFITIIPLFTTVLVLTNKRVLGKSGVIKVDSMDTPLNKINNVLVSQGILGQIFGYGTICITSSSGSHFFKRIGNPDFFKASLMAQIDQFDEDRIKKQALEISQAMKA